MKFGRPLWTIKVQRAFGIDNTRLGWVLHITFRPQIERVTLPRTALLVLVFESWPIARLAIWKNQVSVVHLFASRAMSTINGFGLTTTELDPAIVSGKEGSPIIPLNALTFATAFQNDEKVTNVENLEQPSSWASIAKIYVQDADGSSNAYFLKVSSGLSESAI